jgi:hypothetical protein
MACTLFGYAIGLVTMHLIVDNPKGEESVECQAELSLCKDAFSGAVECCTELRECQEAQ